MTIACSRIQDYWVVIPGFNEAATVRDVAIGAKRYCPNVLIVDDGSTDGTGDVLGDLDVTVLCNEHNLGKAGSLARGFDYALGHGAIGVMTLDADGQHAPEEIPRFFDQAAAHPTAFLIGVRRHEQRRALLARYIANRIADFWIGWAAGLPIADSQSGFRLYPANLLRTVRIKSDKTRSFVFESEILIEAARRGVECQNVMITVLPRSGSRPSHFRPLVDVLRITQMVAWKILSRGLYLRGLWIWLTSSGLKHTSPSLTKGK